MDKQALIALFKKEYIYEECLIKFIYNTQMRNLGGSLTSHISAHTSQTVAAPFRA